MAQVLKATVSMAMVEELEKLFPDKLSSIRPDVTDRQLWTAYGQVSVIQFLRRQAELQNKDPT